MQNRRHVVRLQLARRNGMEIVRRARSNRRFKPSHQGRRLENRPSLPPLKLSKEGSFSPFTATTAPLPKSLHIQSILATHLPLKSIPDRQRHGTA
jgi:hypothetical protein